MYFKVENSYKIKLWLNKSCEVVFKCFYSELKCSKSHQNETELVEEQYNAQKSYLKSRHYDRNENSGSSIVGSETNYTFGIGRSKER